MPADIFAWLHLTDLHLGLKGQGWLWPTLRQPFLDDLALLHQQCGPWDAVLFTGDLVQSGQSAQFQGLQDQVLGPLWEQLTRLGSGAAVLVAVPGNHDLFRPNTSEDNAAIDALVDPDQFARIAAKFWDQPDGGYRRVVNHAFAAWREWWDGALHRPAGIATGEIPGDLAVTLTKGGRRIGLMGLSTAFLQLGAGDYQGKLVWDPRQVQALCPDGIDRWHADHDLCLLLTHQGPDWLTPEARALGDSEIAPAGRFALHLFGHLHEARLEAIRRGANPEAVRLCQGCSVFGMEHFGEPPRQQRAHGYSAGQVRFTAAGPELRLWPRVATNKTGPWRLIPDHDHFHLEPDQGTMPEPLTFSKHSARSPVLVANTFPPTVPLPSGSMTQAPAGDAPNFPQVLHAHLGNKRGDLDIRNNRRDRETTMKIFISHSHNDRPVAEALVEYLSSALMVDDSEILATSVPGHMLPPGENLSEALKEDLTLAPAIIAIITSHSISRPWVIFELGAAWALKKRIFPVLGPSVKTDQLPGPLSSLVSLHCEEHEATSKAIDLIVAIAKVTGLEHKSLSGKLDARSKAFLAALRACNGINDEAQSTNAKELPSAKQTTHQAPSIPESPQDAITGQNRVLIAVWNLAKDRYYQHGYDVQEIAQEANLSIPSCKLLIDKAMGQKHLKAARVFGEKNAECYSLTESGGDYLTTNHLVE